MSESDDLWKVVPESGLTAADLKRAKPCLYFHFLQSPGKGVDIGIGLGFTVACGKTDWALKVAPMGDFENGCAGLLLVG